VIEGVDSASIAGLIVMVMSGTAPLLKLLGFQGFYIFNLLRKITRMGVALAPVPAGWPGWGGSDAAVSTQRQQQQQQRSCGKK
jgi:hypothetical protein